MSKAQQRKRSQKQQARLDVVSELYKRGNSYRKIQGEVMRRLDLKSYSVNTVHNDVQELLEEWRQSRIENVDFALQLELERIDQTVAELWEQWEKSKRDYKKTSSKRKGEPIKAKGAKEAKLQTVQKEETETEVIRLGDVSYLSEIRQQLSERRKLLGLYAPDKTHISHDLPDLSKLSDEELETLIELQRKTENAT